MKRFKSIVIFMVMITMILILFGCSSTTTAPTSGQDNKTEKLVIKFGHHHSVDGAVDSFANKFAEIAKQKSNGNIEIQVFPGAQLGQEQEAIDGIQLGTLQMSIISPGMMDKYLPIYGIETMPFMFDDWDHADKSLNGSAGEKLASMLVEKSNIQVLGYMHLGFRQMITRTKPITKYEDIQGLKMRSPEAWVWIRMFEKLGTKPTPVTWGEAYTALETGVVEGMESPSHNIIDMKFFEVTENLSLTNHMFGTMTVVANKDFLGGLSEEQQKIIRDSVTEALTFANKNNKEADESAVGKLKELGMNVFEINDTEKWREAVKPMYEEFQEKAPGADEIIKIIREVK